MILLDLGEFCISGFVSASDVSGPKYPLTLELCPRFGAPKLKGDRPPAKEMWGEYWYKSGVNPYMALSLQDVVADVLERLGESDGYWLDIAANDGTLLKAVPNKFKKVAIDPVEERIFSEARICADFSCNNYFSKAAWSHAVGESSRAKVITCVSMFYDLDEPECFLRDAHDILDDEGILVLQMSYTPFMVMQNAFDNICHEHFYYHDLTSIKSIAETSGFKIYDVSFNDTNGGSFRIFLRKESIDNIPLLKKFDCEEARIARLEQIYQWEEYGINIRSSEVWAAFYHRIQDIKKSVRDLLVVAKKRNELVLGFGASTKGNTLLQFMEIDSALLPAIVEAQDVKFGKYTAGSGIPIISESDGVAMNPSGYLVLPWHFIQDFLLRKRNCLPNGGHFYVPCPTFSKYRVKI
jgi:SAM-dependent methyltransferase